MSNTIELVLAIGPDAITNTKAFDDVSSLRILANHEVVPADTIRGKILEVALVSWRHGDPAKVPTTDNITNSVNSMPPNLNLIGRRFEMLLTVLEQ